MLSEYPRNIIKLNEKDKVQNNKEIINQKSLNDIIMNKD